MGSFKMKQERRRRTHADINNPGRHSDHVRLAESGLDEEGRSVVCEERASQLKDLNGEREVRTEDEVDSGELLEHLCGEIGQPFIRRVSLDKVRT